MHPLLAPGATLAQGDCPLQGAYGLSLVGLERSDALVASPDAWPSVRIEREHGVTGEEAASLLDEERAVFPLLGGGQVSFHRRDRTATYRTPTRLADDDLVHPLLAPAGAVFARWMGRQALHAGALVVDGRAWGLLGQRGAGKSTLLAHLRAQGHSVLTDDVLVVDGRTALAGPRSIDLREPAATHLGVEDQAGPARAGTRKRVSLPAVAAEVPLGGWIFLEWSGRLEVTPLSTAERLARLSTYRLAWRAGDAPFCSPDLADLPAWELRRPRRWDGLGSATDRLVSLVTGG